MNSDSTVMRMDVSCEGPYNRIGNDREWKREKLPEGPARENLREAREAKV